MGLSETFFHWVCGGWGVAGLGLGLDDLAAGCILMHNCDEIMHKLAKMGSNRAEK